jgi:hypothetical protein
MLYIHSTGDPNVPVIWINEQDYVSPPKLWVAERKENKLQPRMLLKRGADDNLNLQKCWLLETAGAQKLFVQKYGFKKTRLKGELHSIPIYWLNCYALGRDGLNLQGKVAIGEGKTESYEVSVECGVVEGNVYVWVCDHSGRLRRKGTLRVAQWRDEGELTWTECYTTRDDLGSLMSVDPSYGSAAAIFEWKGQQPYSSGIVCQLPPYTPNRANLGYGFDGKHQLLHVQHGRINWLLLNYDEAWNMRILALDSKLQQVKKVEKSYPKSAGLHLVRGNDGACYVVILMEDHIKIEKLQDIAGEQFGPAKEQPRDSEELSQKFISDAYKAYVEEEGKNVVKATNKQLAKEIVTGEEMSLFISYYRLLSRKKKYAERCLTKRITNVVKEGVGQEHWITNMELTFYGEPAIKPLLKIAATGAPEEREIAVEVLYMVPDLTVVNKLLTLLDTRDIRKNSSACLMICDMGVRAGKLEAVDFLIKAATGKFMEKGMDAKRLLDESRRVLIELTAEYKDTPEDWSEEGWSAWWKKHRSTIELPREPDSEQVQRSKEFKRQHLLFQELASMLEENRKARSK